MTYFSNLLFFQKDGSPANFVYDETLDYWTGTLYFPKVSVGLYENQHIFSIEKILVSSSEDYTYPVLANQSSPTSETWKTRWETDESEDQIFTYVIVEDTDGTPFIKKFEEVEFANTAVAYTTASPDTMKILSEANSTSLKINIAFTSSEEDIYERTLIIEDMSFSTPKTVAKINFYGETVGEDERFRIVLENFGRTFNHEDELMLNNSDIKEALPNWINVNQKRKELLLAGEEIYPYVGSYKGLINAVKFFGYQDMRIKEYWMNINTKSENFNKIQMFELTGMFTDEYNPLLKNPLVPSTSYKKTSMFGLFYDITVATGEVDEFGIPTTANESTFTNEEVLIKLFALKEKLKNEFLPLNARIVDIVGEGIYFEKYNIRTWVDPLQTFSANLADVVGFTTNIKTGYVRDLRKFNTKRFENGLDLPMERFTNTVNPYTTGQAYPASSIPGLLESIEDFYTEINSFHFPYGGEKKVFAGDEPGIVAGCPIIFQANISAFTWDDMIMSWDDLSNETIGSPPVYSGSYTWDTIDFSNYYEIEWTIEKPAPNGYSFTFRGSIKDYYQLPHFLPYSGKYKVSVKMFDMFNQRSIQIKEDVVEVLNREIEIAGFCRFRNTDDYSWDGSNSTWDELGGSTWNFPVEGTSLVNSPIPEKLLNWARYKNQEDMQVLNEETGLFEDLIASDNPNAGRIGTRNLSWNNMDVSWDEMYHSTWDMYDYHAEFLGGFRIFDPAYGDTVQIDDFDLFVFTETSSPSTPLTLLEAADLLNASTNPGISKFTYVVRFQYGSPLLSFIHACAKFSGADGWRFIKYGQGSSPGSIYGDAYSFRKPTWLETIIIDDMAAAINNSVTPPVSVDTDLMFLQVPLQDLIGDASTPQISPAPSTLEYWVEKGFKKTEAPTSEFPYGERRGSLPSWYGSGAFTSNDLRVFTTDIICEIPLCVPLFLVHNHSEIPGKTGTRWIVTNELTGEKIIETKDKPFLIINFVDESLYSIECYVTDSNGNESYTKKTGFIKASSRKNMKKPQNLLML